MSSHQRYYSKIYWHFTGSPELIDWGEIKKPSDILKFGKPKSLEQSIISLKGIIKTKELWATASERIVENLNTEKFCCVCDIPFKDLLNHSTYYGEVAIGFSAESIHKEFNPVFYFNYDKLSIIDDKLYVDDNCTIDDDLEINDEESGFKLFEKIFNNEENNFQLAKSLEKTLGDLKNYIKMTSFSDREEETFYSEREWRKIGNFTFDVKNIEAIIVPNKYIEEIRKYLIENSYHDEISILSLDFINKA